mmetsp:Transcript_51283/g.112404  ORF Transcript_51283/g.112404 Transcript_51283/m.112404 type:complete len:283 (+) Transcript_51283:61-909(+)
MLREDPAESELAVFVVLPHGTSRKALRNWLSTFGTVTRCKVFGTGQRAWGQQRGWGQFGTLAARNQVLEKTVHHNVHQIGKVEAYPHKHSAAERTASRPFVAQRPENCVYIPKLQETIGESELLKLLGLYGHVLQTVVVPSKKGLIGFAEFQEREDAAQLLERGSLLSGETRIAVLQYHCPPEDVCGDSDGQGAVGSTVQQAEASGEPQPERSPTVSTSDSWDSMSGDELEDCPRPLVCSVGQDHVSDDERSHILDEVTKGMSQIQAEIDRLQALLARARGA